MLMSDIRFSPLMICVIFARIDKLLSGGGGNTFMRCSSFLRKIGKRTLSRKTKRAPVIQSPDVDRASPNPQMPPKGMFAGHASVSRKKSVASPSRLSKSLTSEG